MSKVWGPGVSQENCCQTANVLRLPGAAGRAQVGAAQLPPAATKLLGWTG